MSSKETAAHAHTCAIKVFTQLIGQWLATRQVTSNRGVRLHHFSVHLRGQTVFLGYFTGGGVEAQRGDTCERKNRQRVTPNNGTPSADLYCRLTYQSIKQTVCPLNTIELHELYALYNDLKSLSLYAIIKKLSIY